MSHHRIFFTPTLVAALACAAAATAWAQPLAPAPAPAPPACDMAFSFFQTDKDAKGGRTAVWADAAGNLMFIEKLNVNTDGTRRSYAVGDFWGETRALNNLCNAMSDACAGLSKDQLRARRIATQEAAQAGWPADQLKATRLSPDIIPMPGGKPCPEVDGYLVSATALHAARVTDVCSLDNYADALKVPSIVIPKGSTRFPSQFLARNVKVGDLVAAMRIDQEAPLMAVVGDTGPVDSLGEASIAMNARLLGKQGEPQNYKDVKTWVAPPTLVLVFAGSRDAAQPYLGTDRIDADAGRRFDAWGGVPRAKACVAAYRAQPTAVAAPGVGGSVRRHVVLHGVQAGVVDAGDLRRGGRGHRGFAFDDQAQLAGFTRFGHDLRALQQFGRHGGRDLIALVLVDLRHALDDAHAAGHGRRRHVGVQRVFVGQRGVGAEGGGGKGGNGDEGLDVHDGLLWVSRVARRGVCCVVTMG